MAGAQITVSQTQLESQRFGYHSISLTNLGSTAEPEIAAGSKVEIGGALFNFAAPESITGWGEIANDSVVWIKLVVAGAAVTAEFTTTAPTWSTSKQGWYSGDDRYVAQLYKDSGGNAISKYLLLTIQKISPERTELIAENTDHEIQVDPIGGTWYNIGSFKLILTPGRWLLSYQVVARSYNVAFANELYVTLSTTNNGETDKDFTSFAAMDSDSFYNTFHRSKIVKTSDITYYLNAKVSLNGDSVSFEGTLGTSRITAVRI